MENIKKIKKPNKKRILIVEDEKSMQRAMKTKFQISGFDVTTADDGEAAIAQITDKKFDVIILDLIMPFTSGFKVLEELKKRNDRTPVIVSTNLSQENDIKRAKDLGVADYFIKSDTPIVKIVEQVKKVINI